MARPKYLRIPPDKWTRYQQKERPDGWRPPWLKLWNAVLDDYRLRALPPAYRFVYVGLLVMANESNNSIGTNPELLKNRLGIPPKLIQNAVRTLVENGLVERCNGSDFEKTSKLVRNDRSREGKRIEVEVEPSAVREGSNGPVPHGDQHRDIQTPNLREIA